MNKQFFVFLLSLIFCFSAIAQPNRWQQRVKYTMNINVDVNTNRYTGKQKLEYTNNSPDVLKKVFYHLYFNAFQPNSGMDKHNLEMGKVLVNGARDWDSRVMDKIGKLAEEEIGYQKIISLKMNGVVQPFEYHETILEVNLTKPIAPNSKVIFDMEFEAQIPLMVRRAGRDNPKTGVRYSMAQWYPKLCEYDQAGWHPTPYVGREFYGVWGDFDVTISIDKNYKLGGSGVLVNAGEIGWGYDSPGTELKPVAGAKRNWHFVGNNIHDFMWAADPEYQHVSRKIRNGLTIHVLFKSNEEEATQWKGLLNMAENAFPYIEKTFGAYPYPQYSFIRGGDGGTEYPMATLLAIVPGAMHELLHSWYQGMLGTNESEYAWMDEGFTNYAGKRVYADLGKKNGFIQEDNYKGYYKLVKSGIEEPLTTHADHFNSFFTSELSTYYKGSVFLEQLGYIVGAVVLDKILLEYYKQWRFKHPNAGDFVKLSEDVSGVKLDWYKEYWCNTVKTIDYGIDSLWEEGGITRIRLQRIGKIPMPIDFQLTFKDGSTEMHYIPLNLMYGAKSSENPTEPRIEHEEWRWTHPTYIVDVKKRLTDLKKAEIDPSKRMADVDQHNNILQLNW